MASLVNWHDGSVCLDMAWPWICLHSCNLSTLVCWGALYACLVQGSSVTPEVYFPSLAHNQRKERYFRILVWLVSGMFVGHGLRNMAWLSVLELHGTVLPLLDMTWHDMAWHGMTWHDMAWHGVDCISWHLVLVSWLRFCPCWSCCHASIVTWMLLAIDAFSWWCCHAFINMCVV